MKIDFGKIALLKKKVAQNGKKNARIEFRGLKSPPEVRVEHETCSTKRGAPVKAIWDHNCVFGIICFP